MKRNSNKWILPVLALGLLTLCFSCKKEEETGPVPPAAEGTVKDIEGNEYHYITIGSQVWMMEDLKVTKYRNGEAVVNVADSAGWVTRTEGAYCSYNSANANIYNSDDVRAAGKAAQYGLLYNWHAVNDTRGLAPQGWHIPTSVEYDTLCNRLGGANYAGERLKEWGAKNWFSPNIATNESGFSALPGGVRYGGISKFAGAQSYYWEAAQATAANGWSRNLYYDNVKVLRLSIVKTSGASIRCIKDK